MFYLNGWPIYSPESPSLLEADVRTQWRGEPGWWQMPGNNGEAVPYVARDGAYLTPSWFNEARMTLQGTMKAADRPTLRDRWEEFKANLPVRDVAPLTGVEDGLTRFRLVRVDQPPVEPNWVTDTLLEWSVQLVVADVRLFAGSGPDDPYSGTADARLPITSGGLRIPGSKVVDTNFSTNPSFEVNLNGWSSAGATLSRQTTSPPPWVSGAWCRLTADGTSNLPRMFRGTHPENTPAINPGQWLGASIKMANSSGYLSYIEMRFYQADGNTIVSQVPDSAVSHSGERVTFAAQAPAGTAFGSPAFIMKQASNAVVPSGTLLDVDAVKISVADTQADALTRAADYFSGDSPASGNYSYRWTSTVGRSTSERVLAGGLRVPFRIGAKVTRSSVTVPVFGTAPPQVVAVITAVNEPVVRPTIKDQDGNVMTFNLTLDIGQSLVLNWDDKSILLNGQVSRRNSLRGDWLPLGTQPREWSFSADGYQPTNAATLTVNWRDAWI